MNDSVGWPDICKEEAWKIGDKGSQKGSMSDEVSEVTQSVRIFILHVNSL